MKVPNGSKVGEGWGDGLSGQGPALPSEGLSSRPQHPHEAVSYADKAALSSEPEAETGRASRLLGQLVQLNE